MRLKTEILCYSPARFGSTSRGPKPHDSKEVGPP